MVTVARGLHIDTAIAYGLQIVRLDTRRSRSACVLATSTAYLPLSLGCYRYTDVQNLTTSLKRRSNCIRTVDEMDSSAAGSNYIAIERRLNIRPEEQPSAMPMSEEEGLIGGESISGLEPPRPPHETGAHFPLAIGHRELLAADRIPGSTGVRVWCAK